MQCHHAEQRTGGQILGWDAQFARDELVARAIASFPCNDTSLYGLYNERCALVPKLPQHLTI